VPTLAEKRAAKKKRDREKEEALAARREKRASTSKNPEMKKQNKMGEAKHTTYNRRR
jgi:hypothetical protein